MPTVYHREINTRVLFFRHSEARKNPSGGKNISLGMKIQLHRDGILPFAEFVKLYHNTLIYNVGITIMSQLEVA